MSDFYLWYILPVAFCGIIGSMFVNKLYYKKIQENTPYWTPSPIIFGIIWTLIYLMFIFVFYELEFYSLFIITILLNIIWTPIFFKFNNKVLSFIIIVLMFILAMYTLIKLTEKVDELKISDPDRSNYLMILSYIFMIYPIWLIFAGCLVAISGFTKKE